MRYQLSAYTRRFDKGGHSALFNGLTLRKAYGKRAVMDGALETIAAPYDLGDDEVVDSLIRLGFIVSSGSEGAWFERLRNEVGRIDISNIVMIVDNRCNYSCTYCQIEENMNKEQKNHRMPIGVAERALTLFERNSRAEKKKKTVSITGGEPLMNLPTVKYIIDRVTSIPHSRVVIFTNGSLITRDLARYFAEKQTLMLLSLDGPRGVHDAVRVKANGTGTFDASMRGYELLVGAGCKTGVSAVMGTHNVDRVDELVGFFEALGPASVGLNFGHYLLHKDNPTQIDMKRFAGMLTAAYRRLREKGIFVENISRFIAAFCEERPRFNECQAQGRGFSVDSRGKVGICKSLLVSDVISRPLEDVEEDLAKHQVFQDWASRSPFALEECRGCPLIGVCGGGCVYDAFVINRGDIRKLDRRVCDYTESIVTFLIWDLFEAVEAKIGDGIYVPSVDEQVFEFRKHYDSRNELQRSVGHEKEN